MLEPMNKHSISAIGHFTLKVGGITIGLVVALLGAFRDLFASAETTNEEESDILAGAYKGGTLNYRTGKLDDGTDPYGWYGKD